MDPEDDAINAQYLINRDGIARWRDIEPEPEMAQRLKLYGTYGLTTEEVQLLHDGGVKPWDDGLFVRPLVSSNLPFACNASAGLRPCSKRSSA